MLTTPLARRRHVLPFPVPSLVGAKGTGLFIAIAMGWSSGNWVLTGKVLHVLSTCRGRMGIPAPSRTRLTLFTLLRTPLLGAWEFLGNMSMCPLDPSRCTMRPRSVVLGPLRLTGTVR